MANSSEAVMVIEKYGASLTLIEEGTHLVEFGGAVLFPVYGNDGNVTDRMVSMIAKGDDKRLLMEDVKWDGTPFTSNDVHAVAVIVQAGEDADTVKRSLVSAINKLRVHMYPQAPGHDPVMDSCWRI